MNKKTLLDRAATAREERTLLAHVLDKREQCLLKNIPTHTDFLSPAELRSAADMLRAAAAAEGWTAVGGYEQAERRILFFLPSWQEEPDTESAITALRVHFRPEDAPSHRDLLGSLMALGLVRGKLGDILLGEASADVLACAESADYLLREWTSAGRARLRGERISLSELSVPERRVRELRDTVATLRLDAVIASGFSLSRAKAVELIGAGRVQLNYREALKPDAAVKQGDVISARGLGKLELAEVGGLSRKGRTTILIRRYL